MSTTIGIDLGGTKLLAVRMENNDIVDQAQVPTPGGAHELSRAAIAAAQEVWADGVEGIGVGIAGLVRFPEGVFVWGPHVAGTQVPVRDELEQGFGLPCVVDNDANTGAWGELHLGAGRGFDDMLLVTLGTGIGGAIVVGGELHRGGSFAGEWGHVLYAMDGLQCDCGKRGCWETVASGPALVRLARDHLARNPQSSLALQIGASVDSGEQVTLAADTGNEIARGLVTQVGEAFGRGLANLIAIFDPQIIVVGGGLGSVGESIVGPARRVAANALHGGSHRGLPPIEVAGLGASAGAIGAALLAEDLVTGRLKLD